MSGTNLTNSTATVLLESYGTGNPFSVGADVSIIADAGYGIYANNSQAWTLTNAGTIGARDAASYATGGAGIDFLSQNPNTRLTNTGTIFGGMGGYGSSTGLKGGTGVQLDAYVTVTNSGTILGGAGGEIGGVAYGGKGGAGIFASEDHNIIHILAGGEVRAGAGGVAHAAGATGGYGGIGVSLGGDSGAVVNSGAIRGGAAGAVGNGSYGGDGGTGVLLTGSNARLTNHGLIVGGAGSGVKRKGGEGGAGVRKDTGRLSLWNSGTIQGGAGGDSANAEGGSGGHGVSVLRGILVNQAGGKIAGGDGGDGNTRRGRGGSGIYQGSDYAFTILNSGVIAGGAAGGSATTGSYGGGRGTDIKGSSAVLRNLAGGTITGGTGALGGGAVEFYGALFTNAGTITGGAGTYNGGVGAGLYNADGDFTNLAGGKIVGGAGGTAGHGVSINGGSFTNAAGASITGGASNSGGTHGGNGGAGLYASNATLANSGTITGGQGGNGSQTGGDGGVGVQLSGRLVNNGTIAGGQGGSGSTTAGLGGLGVSSLYGGSTLIDRGTISGGGNAKAVQFGGYSDRLILGTGAVFNGGVDGGNGTNTMVLAGTSGTGTISGIGTNFTKFQKVSIRSDASWKMDGSNTFVSGGTLSVFGALDVTGTAVFDGAVRGLGTLSVSGAITIDTHAKFTVTDLLLTGTGTATLNRNLSYAGNLTQEAGTVFKVADGKLLATSCMVDGAGTIELGAGSIFLAKACVGEDETVSFTGAKGWLGIDFPTSFEGSVKGFAVGDRIDLSSTDFAFSGDETVTFQENDGGTAGTLTVTKGSDVFAVQLFGQYVASGFHLGADKHGGTLISYHPTVTASAVHDLAPGGHS